MTVVIDSAIPDDAAAIAEVHLASLLASHEELLPERTVSLVLEAGDERRRARMWRAWLERSRVVTVVARSGGGLAGFCAMREMPTEGARGESAEISALFVCPSHWRRGLGRLLFESTLVEARARGFTELVVWALEPNARARRFYESLGFRADGETRIFLESSEGSLSELRYRRELSPAA